MARLTQIPVSNFALQHLRAHAEFDHRTGCISAVTIKNRRNEFSLESVSRRA